MDIEKELGISVEIEKYLEENMQALSFEGTNNMADLTDNWIFYFQSPDEDAAIAKITEILQQLIPEDSKLNFKIKKVSEIVSNEDIFQNIFWDKIY